MSWQGGIMCDYIDPDMPSEVPSIDYYRDELERIYEEFRRRGDAPECLREFLYETIGRIL